MNVEKLHQKLADIVGERYVSCDLCDRIAYSKDYSIEGLVGNYVPDIVVKPGSTSEVAEVIKLANVANVPVYTWGGGTTMSGNCLPVYGGIVLDMKRMNKIIEVDTENLTVTVQAGATMDKVYREVKKNGYFFTHHPESAVSSTIGGALSCYGVSVFSAKYGCAYDQVLGLEIVLGTGDVIRIGGKNYVSVPSHNLMNLFLGAEGTLGVITEATLKIYPMPVSRKRISIGFPSLEQSIKACIELVKVGITPETVYLFEYINCGQYLERAGVEVPGEFAAAILFGFSGDEDLVDFFIERTEKVCAKFGGFKLDQKFAEAWWESIFVTKETLDRNPFPTSHRKVEPDLIDACVPIGRVKEYYEEYVKLRKKYGWDHLPFGFTAVASPRGPIPFLIYLCIPIDTSDEKEIEKWFKFKEEMYGIAMRLGGTLSDGNGIGLRTNKWVRDELGPAFDVLKKIKKLLDPNNILNRGIRGF